MERGEQRMRRRLAELVAARPMGPEEIERRINELGKSLPTYDGPPLPAQPVADATEELEVDTYRLRTDAKFRRYTGLHLALLEEASTPEEMNMAEQLAREEVYGSDQQ